MALYEHPYQTINFYGNQWTPMETQDNQSQSMETNKNNKMETHRTIGNLWTSAKHPQTWHEYRCVAIVVF